MTKYISDLLSLGGLPRLGQLLGALVGLQICAAILCCEVLNYKNFTCLRLKSLMVDYFVPREQLFGSGSKTTLI